MYSDWYYSILIEESVSITCKSLQGILVSPWIPTLYANPYPLLGFWIKHWKRRENLVNHSATNLGIYPKNFWHQLEISALLSAEKKLYFGGKNFRRIYFRVQARFRALLSAEISSDKDIFGHIEKHSNLSSHWIYKSSKEWFHSRTSSSKAAGQLFYDELVFAGIFSDKGYFLWKMFKIS